MLATPAPPRAAPVVIDVSAEPDLERSVLPTAVAVDVRALVSGLELPPLVALTADRESPPDAESGDWIELTPDTRYRARVTPGELRAESRDDGTLDIEIPLFISAVVLAGRGARQEVRSCGCGGEAWCGGRDEAPRQGRVRVRARLRVDEQWHVLPELESELSVDERCLAAGDAGRPTDLTRALRRVLAARREPLERALADALRSSDALQRAAQRLWRSLSRPLPLAGHGSLRLRPEAIALGAVEGDGEHLRVPVRVALRPVWGPGDGDDPIRELARDDELGDPALVALGVVSQPIELLSRHVRERLVGVRYRSATQRDLQIVDAEVYGSSSEMVVRLRFGGAASGDLFLRGRERHSDGVLSLDPLRLDPRSTQELARLFDDVEMPDLRIRRTPWIDRERLLADVREACRWPLVVGVSPLVQQALRERAPTRDAHLDEEHVLRVQVDGEALHLVVLLRGGFAAREPAPQESD